MNLPNASNAEVEREKTIGYLLNARNPNGSSKASVFGQFGFAPGQWEYLAEALRQHGFCHPVSRATETGFGQRYAVEERITTPEGRNPNIHTVWQWITASLPATVTAYPLEHSI